MKTKEFMDACARDVEYLRSRHRWTPELEGELIRLHSEGTPPQSMMDFGVTSETQAALMDTVRKALESKGIEI